MPLAFNNSSLALCEALATMTRRISTEYIDPSSIEALVASRLIPLDKSEGAVRPIGVGEVVRRVFSKCVKRIVKPDVMEASGSLQLCAGQSSGVEAATMLCEIFFIFAINTYRVLSRLFIVGGKELKSSEGTTQGDPLSMAIYAVCLQPFITNLHNASSAEQCWFADDYCGAGSATEIKRWWDILSTE